MRLQIFVDLDNGIYLRIHFFFFPDERGGKKAFKSPFLCVGVLLSRVIDSAAVIESNGLQVERDHFSKCVSLKKQYVVI